MALPKRRTGNSDQGHRRSHHGLKRPPLVTCTRCRSKHINHRPCPTCGTYNGRQVLHDDEDLG